MLEIIISPHIINNLSDKSTNTISLEYRNQHFYIEPHQSVELSNTMKLAFIEKDGEKFIELTHDSSDSVNISLNGSILDFKVNNLDTLWNDSSTVLYPWTDAIQAVVIRLVSDETIFYRNLLKVMG